MELDYKAIGKRIRLARLNRGLTQEALADRIGLSPSHMSNIETGTTRVSLTTLVNLANALGTTADGFLCDSLSHARPQLEEDIREVLEGCGEDELRLVREVSRAVVEAVRRNKRLEA